MAPKAIQRGIHELYYRYSRSHATQTKTKKKPSMALSVNYISFQGFL